MMYKQGDKAYITESGRIIREVIVVRVAGGMYTLKFTDTGGGVKLREGRLYSSKEAAEDAVKDRRKKNT